MSTRLKKPHRWDVLGSRNLAGPGPEVQEGRPNDPTSPLDITPCKKTIQPQTDPSNSLDFLFFFIVFLDRTAFLAAKFVSVDRLVPTERSGLE